MSIDPNAVNLPTNVVLRFNRISNKEDLMYRNPLILIYDYENNALNIEITNLTLYIFTVFFCAVDKIISLVYKIVIYFIWICLAKWRI